jgi:hypothetical protein
MPKRVSWTDTAVKGANEDGSARVVLNCPSIRPSEVQGSTKS